MHSPSDTKPRWERRKDARPQELLAAALDLFVDKGYAATRLDDVAARAGVSKGTLYLYFTNKEELFKAVVRENLLPALGEAEAAIEECDGPSAELFRGIMLGWWERIGNTQLSGICKLMISESGNFPELARFYHEEVISRGNKMITSLLQRGIARGEFRAVDTQQLARALAAPILMLMIWKHSFCLCPDASISAPDYLSSYLDLCLHGLLPAAVASTAQMELPC